MLSQLYDVQRFCCSTIAGVGVSAWGLSFVKGFWLRLLNGIAGEVLDGELQSAENTWLALP